MAIGLDSASPTFIDKWIDDLPNLRLLNQTGTHGVLQSVVPPSSVPAWQCFATGKNPGKIGVWGFLSIGPDRQLRHGRTSEEIGCLWDVCGKAGSKVGVFNVPGTYPPYPVNGFMVSGFPTPPGKTWAYPTDLMKKLDKAVDGYEIDVPLTKPSEMKGGEEAYLSQVERLHTKSVEAAKHLLEWFRPDLFVMTLQGVDMVQHDFSRYMDKSDSEYSNVVHDWYVRLDEAVGELRKYIDSDTYLLALSDHGSLPITTSLHVNEFLKSKGILKTNPSSAKKKRESYGSLRRFILKRLSPNMIRAVYRITPDFLAHKLTVSAQHERTLTRLVDSIDWPNTQAFSTGGPQAAIYINTQDYNNGQLKDPRRRAELLESLRTMFSDLTHPSTNEKIRAVFHLREDTFKGPYQDEAPDLAVELFSQDEKIHIIITLDSGRIWSFSPHLSSEHVREGFWSLTGPGVQKGLKLDASILDLAPTLQKAMGLQPSADVDGRVLESAFQKSWLSQSERMSVAA
jgi:predicted AlkP superfamily phosphohydrolase/phosphomutase